MGKFLVVHPQLPSPLTIEEATPIGQKVKANSTLDAYWVKTCMHQDLHLCVWVWVWG